MAARFSLNDYVGGIKGLFPFGRAWPREEGSTQSLVVEGLAPTPWRLDAAAIQLLVDAFPATASALLSEWEASVGFPDPVARIGPTEAKRREHMLARFVGVNGQAIADLETFAARFSIEVSVANYAPFRASHSRAGHPCCGDDWAYALNVTVADSGSIPSWDQAILEAELLAIAPAHGLLTVIFA